MISMILSLVLFLIFMVLGGFHFYWVFGGVWGLEKVIPTNANEKNTLSIPKFATIIVGLALSSAGLFYLMKSGFLNVEMNNKLINYIFWFIPFIFVLRAIGEFKFVGFFKKIKNTEFAKADSKIFSPLCLCIGILGIVIQLIGK